MGNSKSGSSSQKNIINDKPIQLIGHLCEYVPGDDFIEYLERVDSFFEMNKIKDSELKKQIIILHIGSKPYSQLKTLIAPNTIAETNFETIINKLKVYYTTDIINIVNHFLFNKRDQQPEESIQDYATELQLLAKSCKFGSFKDIALRDKFIAGLRSATLQQALLNEALTQLQKGQFHISFDELVRIARCKESSSVKSDENRGSCQNMNENEEDVKSAQSNDTGAYQQIIESVEIPVNVSGEDVAKVIDTFENSCLTNLMMGNIKRLGYIYPTSIQKNAIPIVLAGRDIIVCSQTGSGKILAFLLPIISKLLNDENPLSNYQPHVLILSPTSERGIKIETQCRKFTEKTRLKTILVHSGNDGHIQMNKAKDGCHILIATPDRLENFSFRTAFTFEDLRVLVLDEADRMIDMGFLPNIEQLLQSPSIGLPYIDRQIVIFSATFSERLQQMADTFLHRYLFVSTGIVSSSSSIKHCVLRIPTFEKHKQLMKIINNKNVADSTLIFVERENYANTLALFLSEKRILTYSIHGDRYQREMALNEFKSGKCRFLIAASIDACKLDIKNVRHVINFDMPRSIDEYLQRIVIGYCSKITSFYNAEKDFAIASGLKKMLHQAGQTVPEFLMNVDIPSSKFQRRPFYSVNDRLKITKI